MTGLSFLLVARSLHPTEIWDKMAAEVFYYEIVDNFLCFWTQFCMKY